MKRIIILIDGTWDKEGTTGNTNVAKLGVNALIKRRAANGTVQQVRYHDGVGAAINSSRRGIPSGWLGWDGLAVRPEQVALLTPEPKAVLGLLGRVSNVSFWPQVVVWKHGAGGFRPMLTSGSEGKVR